MGFMKEFKWMAGAILFGIVWISLNTASEKANPVRREEAARVEAATQSAEHRAAVAALETASPIFPPACYVDDVNVEAKTAVLRPEIWIGMTEEARARFEKIWLLTVDASGSCKRAPVINGIISGYVQAPYTALYNAYLRALEAGDATSITLLQKWFRPTALTSVELPTLFGLDPAKVDGGLEGYERMLRLFEVRDYRLNDQAQMFAAVSKTVVGHAFIFRDMGGQVTMTCDRRPEIEPGKANFYSIISGLVFNFKYMNIADRAGTFVVPAGCGVNG